MAIAKRAKKAVVKAKVKAPAARRKRQRLPYLQPDRPISPAVPRPC
jgi:hypothetical protein